MRDSLAPRLRCPRCRTDGALHAVAGDRGADEIRTGVLTCISCGWTGPIRDGIVDLLDGPPSLVAAEIAGLGRFADVMRADGWDRDRVLALPDEPSPYWHGQRASFAQLREEVAFRPGQRLLDVGSNTCWAAAAFARDGLDVIALDIAAHELQGLATADWWMQRDGTHLERVLGLMFDLPLADASVDHVFCCEVLHHNTLPTLFATFREAHRVLAPGGTLSVVRETLRAPGNLQLRPGHEVAEFEGNEHAFTALTYLAAARAAGFDVRVLDPADHWVLSDAPFAPARRARGRVKLAALEAVRRRKWSRRAYRRALHHLTGSVPFSFLATRG